MPATSSSPPRVALPLRMEKHDDTLYPLILLDSWEIRKHDDGKKTKTFAISTKIFKKY
jgi:hypothetical protein